MAKNKKIGILNFQYSDHNYGAVLQATALAYIVHQLGFDDVEHINFVPKRKVTLKNRIGNVLRKIGLRKSVRPVMHNKEAFERFRQKHLKRSAKVTSHKAFQRIAQRYDAIIVGSDQVWRPSMAHNAAVYFLQGVPSSVTRVSYAASFGVDHWEPSEEEQVSLIARKELPNFHAISTREDSGVTICAQTFDVEAEHVLDPLLLVDMSFFDAVAPSSQQDYADFVYYKLDTNPQFFADIASLEKHFGTTARNIYHQLESNVPSYEEVDIWLSSIRHAKVVLTDSFHCACIALRFNKDVLFIVNQNRGKARFDSLFKMFDIKLKALENDLPKDIFRMSSPNFGERYDEHRSKSLTFLKSALD
ncbi:polysaccharide pyruvyl transferase family protein [Pseudidiomarina salilacus]|uniref:polysaccharide pyruvyl transferase family protein n=1 Tax=Pseudidiomarina salilacus TaxID=3384452 RepID=UPI00398545ED